MIAIDPLPAVTPPSRERGGVVAREIATGPFHLQENHYRAGVVRPHDGLRGAGIMILLSGTWEESGGGRSVTVLPGTIVVRRHTEDAAAIVRQGEARTIELTIDEQRFPLADTVFLRIIDYLVVRNTATVHLWRRIAAESWSPGRANRLAIEGLVLQLIAAISRHGETASTGETWLEELHDRLVREFVEPPTVLQLAADYGIERRAIVRRFEQRYGMRPAQFVRALRVRRASYLLLTTNRSLSWIADNCGFRGTSHFSRVFSAATGRRPADYRKLDPSSAMATIGGEDDAPWAKAG